MGKKRLIDEELLSEIVMVLNGTVSMKIRETARVFW